MFITAVDHNLTFASSPVSWQIVPQGRHSEQQQGDSGCGRCHSRCSLPSPHGRIRGPGYRSVERRYQEVLQPSNRLLLSDACYTCSEEWVNYIIHRKVLTGIWANGLHLFSIFLFHRGQSCRITYTSSKEDMLAAGDLIMCRYVLRTEGFDAAGALRWRSFSISFTSNAASRGVVCWV